MLLVELLTDREEVKILNLDAISQVEPQEEGRKGKSPMTRIYMTSPSNMAHGHLYVITKDELGYFAKAERGFFTSEAVAEHRKKAPAK